MLLHSIGTVVASEVGNIQSMFDLVYITSHLNQLVIQTHTFLGCVKLI